MTPPLETPRLFLRPLELADATQAQGLFPQWEIVKYLANKVPWPYPPDGALTFYRDGALPAVERGEQWYWTLRRKERPEVMIGSINLSVGDVENRGFWNAPEWQGPGTDERGMRGCDRLLVRDIEVSRAASAEGDCEYGFAPDFGKAGDASGGDRRSRLCLRSVGLGDLGDHGRTVAGAKTQEIGCAPRPVVGLFFP
jgi:Acetyltransferase (GNAT) domain